MANRYLGNRNTKQYHDLHNTTGGCQIKEIKESIEFSSEQQAKQAGYSPCDFCLGRSAR